MALSPADILWAIVVPILLATAIGLLGWQPWRHGAIVGNWVAPVAMAAAFIIGFPGINNGSFSWPLITPHETTAWLPWIGVIAILAGLASATLCQPRWIVAILIFVLAIVACAMLAKFKFASNQWTFAGGAAMVVFFALIATAFALSLEQAREQSPWLAALIIGITAACSALTLMLTDSVTLGKFGLILGFATAGLLPAMTWDPRIPLRGLPATFSVILIPLLLTGHYLAGLSTTLLAILFAMPLFILAGILLPRRWTGWKRIVPRLIIATIPLIVVVVIAAVQFQRVTHEKSQDSDESYYSTH